MFERMRCSVSAAVLGVGLMLGGTAMGQMTPQAPTQPGQTPSGQSGSPSTNDQTQTSQSQDAGQPTVLVDPGKIYNANPTAWVGKSVVLQNVMVQDTNDTGNFWVGSDSSHRLLVVKAANNPDLDAKRFRKGDVVTIQGVVQPASKYASQETTASSGSMKDAEKSSGVFLLANDVTVASSTQR